MLNGFVMTPSQIIRVSFGDALINIPLFRLPYVGGQDSGSSPGGFFTDHEGELGILVDSRLPAHELQNFVSSEIQKNVTLLSDFLQSRERTSTSFVSARPSASQLPS